jgi:hypothetical protein
MKRNLGLALAAIRELGVYPIWLYTLYEVQRHVGWLRLKTPLRDWNAIRLDRQVLQGIPTAPDSYAKYRSNLDRYFLFTPEEDASQRLREILAGDEVDLIKEADGILEGCFSFFTGPQRNFDFPPDWNNFPLAFDLGDMPFEGRNAHWSKIEIEGLPGDIKLIWELSRFGWVFTLARAYGLTRDRKYAQGFWKLLSSWRNENPPNRGYQWISAQEVAIRLLTLIFGHYAFHPFLKERPQRLVTLTETIAAHADRIPATLLYSRSQGNNHLIVEAVGLYSAGLMFPELKQARRWQRIGKRWFISAISDQVFADGGYIQHSVNYQRLALQTSLWALRLGELNGEVFPQKTRESLQKMSTCLGALLDPVSGLVPNFGSNDGALIFPLTSCAFQDFRPVIQTASQMLFEEEAFPPGPWDEEGLWLGIKEQGGSSGKGSGIITNPIKRDSFPDAGLHFLGNESSWGLLRCVEFSNRPGHSDQLHLDLWWKGENIARDPGTYLYNGKDPWENGLSTCKVHNTVVVDDREPMHRAGRFLWLKWTRGEILSRIRSGPGNVEIIVACHDGHEDLGITVVRSVIHAGDALWTVVDELRGHGTHRLRNGWLLPDFPWRMDGNTLKMGAELGEFKIEILTEGLHLGLYRTGELIAGKDVTDCGPILGWHSPTYAYKEPGLYLAASVEGELPLRLVTQWCLGDADPGLLQIEWDDTGLTPMSLKRVTYGDEVLGL